MAGSIEAVHRRHIAQLALSIAMGYAKAKVRESGGSNRGDQVEFFQRLMGGAPGDPWCADFVCSCLVKGYARAHALPEDRSALPGYLQAVCLETIELSASCAELESSARLRGLWQPKAYRPIAGDLVLFDFEGAGVSHHVEIVRTGLARDGRFGTVGGNTRRGETGSQGEGDGVFVRCRALDFVRGWVGW